LVHELDYKQSETPKELLDIVTWHASNEEAVGAIFIPGNMGAATNGGRAVPNKATVKGTRKGAKGGKKGQKHRHRRVAIVASKGNSDEGADNSGDEFIVAAECNFKWQTWPPKDHFKKLLEATCLHHPYLVNHKLMDCIMIKKFMMLGTFSRGSKL
jgi:hypothetical protein